MNPLPGLWWRWVHHPGRDSLVEGLLQGLLLAPGFLDAVPHLGQEVLQVAQELGLILPQLGPELPDLLPAGREEQGSKKIWIVWGSLSLGMCGPGGGRAPAPGTKAAAHMGTKAGEALPCPILGDTRGCSASCSLFPSVVHSQLLHEGRKVFLLLAVRPLPRGAGEDQAAPP